MQPDFTASFWPRFVRTLVISSIATIAYLRMTTKQEHMDFRDVNFDPCDCLISLGTRPRPSPLSSRRNSRLKAQHGKQSKLRVSKRSLPGEKIRKNVRLSNAAYDIHLVQQVLADPSIQIIHITTFTTSFDFRSIASFDSEPKSKLPLDPIPADNVLQHESSQQTLQTKPIFTLPQVRAGLVHLQGSH